MADGKNVQVVLKSRPAGEPKPSDFEIVESAVPKPGPGELLCRTIYLSLDPYMRGRISGVRSYARSVEIGEVIVGGTVSQVVESNHPGFAPGDFVQGYDGWQSFGVSGGAGLRKLDPRQAPISTALGVLGMPGMTAYVGLLDIGRPKPGETVVVSAASGAVGAVVGQIAKLKGSRAVGVAGSAEKCRYVVDALGFDACVSHREPGLPAALKAACPTGIDVYFENVGGLVLEAVLPLINQNARIPLCGLISEYNAIEPARGPSLRPILFNRALIQGFIISDHLDRMPDFARDCSAWLRDGRLKYREDTVDGLANAPQAFIGLLAGMNFGKLLVRVSPDPTRYEFERQSTAATVDCRSN
ncbi:MAG: NADP-dependent oxidoreductase [Candidatus Rokubacteria bacterium]|nr:NADP-dependent oxidoreductase [Candidatus Rokubacteria bacterium]